MYNEFQNQCFSMALDGSIVLTLFFKTVMTTFKRGERERENIEILR